MKIYVLALNGVTKLANRGNAAFAVEFTGTDTQWQRVINNPECPYSWRTPVGRRLLCIVGGAAECPGITHAFFMRDDALMLRDQIKDLPERDANRWLRDYLDSADVDRRVIICPYCFSSTLCFCGGN